MLEKLVELRELLELELVELVEDDMFSVDEVCD